ncbi:MAG: ABC transporter substrate-binding protein, partial [Anaerolineae bacterium]
MFFQKRIGLLASLLLVLMLILAACGGQDTATDDSAATDDNSTTDDGGTAADDSSGEMEAELEVFSWWTSGGEAAALDALFNAFSSAQPDVEIINATVAGGGGSAARPVLQTRLAGGDPPDTWQVHPGNELLGQYLAAGFTAPVGDLYEEEGWYDVVPSGLVNLMLDENGEPHAVLAGVHRGNGFWYNKQVLDANSIEIGDSLSMDEFFEIADTLQAAGVTPLCVGDSGIWASAQLFENTLLGVIGPEKYNDLWNGSVPFDDPQVKEAMEIYGRLLDYQNEDHAALSWDQAVGKLIEGSCAFNSMGDWAYGEFVNAGLEDNVDFGWISHPGTAGSFMIVSDGFTLANGAPHPNATIEWLRAVGSKEGQEEFNQLKGSICARTDCDRDKFGQYHNWSMDSFAADALVPTVVHGSAAPADFQQALNDAVTSFVVTKDVDAFAAELVAGSASFSDATSSAIVDSDEAVAVLDSTQLEVFSWWTSGGEAAALDALFNTLTAAQPNIEIINATVAGGGGSAARPVLQTRLA